MTTSNSIKIVGFNGIEPLFPPADIHKFLATNSVVRVWFRKKNGDIRSLTGTVNPDAIPHDQRPTGQRTPPANQICIYDLENADWRSFRADNMVQMEVVSWFGRWLVKEGHAK